MKKFFLFAAVAGMLASCSSESLTGSDPNIEPTQEDRVPIEIGVATTQTKVSTRGTGTAGDLAGIGKNIWNGERINVLMYEIDDSGNPTFIFTKGYNDANLYDGTTSLVTPLTDENTATGIAKEPTSAATIGAGQTYAVKYYPASGRSDFWGYYLGGHGYATPAAADDAAGDGALTMYANANLDDATAPAEADAKYVATDFVIDGTHDLLVGQAPTGLTDAYSAKAARAGIQPNITFSHVLTRLTFKAEAGNENAANAVVTVTGIKVHSKTTGKLIVAYKVAPANRIVWDATEAALDFKLYPALTMKERTSAVDRTLQNLTAVPLTWSAGAAVPENIGEALLVAPQDKYYIEIDYTVSAQAARDWYLGTSGYVAVPASTTLTAGKTYYTDINGGGAFVAVGTEISGNTNYFTVSYPAVPAGTTLTIGKTYYNNADGTGAFVATGSENTSSNTYYTISYTPVASGTTLTGGVTYYKSDNTGSGLFVSDGTEVAVVKNYFQVLYTAVPAGTTLTIGKTYYNNADGTGAFVATGSEDTSNNTYYEIFVPGDFSGTPTTITMPTYKATIPTEGSGITSFVAGKSYEIGVKLYGPEEIKITTTLTAWENGGSDTIEAE